MKIELIEEVKKELTTSDMKIGDIGVLKGGSIVLRTYSGLVNLQDPSQTWTWGPFGGTPIDLRLERLFVPGDSVKLTVE